MPVEGQGRFAKSEAVEVTRDDAFHRFQMVGAARVDADRQRVGVRIESDERVIRPGRAARILGECHGAMPGGEFDGKIMLPMLAQLLERSEERRVGKSVSVRVDLGGRRIIKNKKKINSRYRNRTPCIIKLSYYCKML